MDLKNFIMENALILIPVLNIIGVMIKGTKKIRNSYIPLILLVLGILGSVLLMGWSGESVVQGVLVAGASVYGHQLVTQCQDCIETGKKKGASGSEDDPSESTQAQPPDDNA